MNRYKWVAFSHDWSYEDNGRHLYANLNDCYNDMRDAVLNKMKWNTEYDEDFDSPAAAVSYKVWFEQGMIVHQSYSGTYVYLIVNEDENPSYYDVFNEKMLKHLKEIDMIDVAGVNAVELYQNLHKEQEEKEMRMRRFEELRDKIQGIQSELADIAKEYGVAINGDISINNGNSVYSHLFNYKE
jgi:hypothetical protein